MKQFAYKGMTVTALTSDEAKVLGNLAHNCLKFLDSVFENDLSMSRDNSHLAEKNKCAVIDTGYYIFNKSGKSLNITFKIVLRPAPNGSVYLNKSTIDYEVKIGKEFVTGGTLSGKKLEEKDKLKDALANVFIFIRTFAEL